MISTLIRLSVHVQLVSLLQWHLFSMQWSTRFYHSTHQWTWSYVHVQLVSLIIHSCATSKSATMTSSKSISSMSKLISESASMTLSMRWSSHRSIYQWIDSSISSRATSESASITSILNAMIYSLSSLYSSVNLIIRSHATSESATMTSSKSISSMSKSISEFASMTLLSCIVSLLQ